MMNTPHPTPGISFEHSGWNNRDVKASGIAELEGLDGTDIGEGMAMFMGRGYEMFVANTETGRVRKFSDAEGNVLVPASDIDMESVRRFCPNGMAMAMRRRQRYAGMNRYSNFSDGVAALSWTLYPDGRYFGDSDGYGAEKGREEKLYCVIDRDLEIVRPFAAVSDVPALLRSLAPR